MSFRILARVIVIGVSPNFSIICCKSVPSAFRSQWEKSILYIWDGRKIHTKFSDSLSVIIVSRAILCKYFPSFIIGQNIHEGRLIILPWWFLNKLSWPWYSWVDEKWCTRNHVIHPDLLYIQGARTGPVHYCQMGISHTKVQNRERTNQSPGSGEATNSRTEHLQREKDNMEIVDDFEYFHHLEFKKLMNFKFRNDK